MNKEKQIEEMDCKKCLHFEACQIAFRNSKALSIYEDDYTEEEYFADTLDCDYYLDKTIYRKASEVAREVCAEIGKRFDALLKMLPADGALVDAKTFIDAHWEFIEHSIVFAYDAELKKKYTGV